MEPSRFYDSFMVEVHLCVNMLLLPEKMPQAVRTSFVNQLFMCQHNMGWRWIKSDYYYFEVLCSGQFNKLRREACSHMDMVKLPLPEIFLSEKNHFS